MATAKQSANIFGTFLENITPGPSKKPVDFEQITKQAIDWSSSQGPRPSSTEAPAADQGRAGSNDINVVLRSIDAAGSPLSVASIAKSTKLDVDALTTALRDATFAGLLARQDAPGGGVIFALTPDGHDLIH
jgi:hypothetical protein